MRLHIDLSVRDRIVWKGDAELLHRAVENVLRNAIHHAPQGTAIEVGVSGSDEHVTIRIRDRGPGVPPSQLTEIFRPFTAWRKIAAVRTEAASGSDYRLPSALSASITERSMPPTQSLVFQSN